MIERIGLQLSRRRVIVYVAFAAVLVLGAAIVLLIGASGVSRPSGARRAPEQTASHVGGKPTRVGRPSAPASADAEPAPRPLARTDDPEQYAREITGALFGVQPENVTRSGFLRFWRGELPTVVYSDAAAKGLSLSAQNDDVIANLVRWWVPSSTAWSSEAADRTTNKFAITSVTVPDYWANAVAEGTFRDPGLHMERVMGVLTQVYGTDHRYTSARSVVIDLALLCFPTQPRGCRLVAPQQPPAAGNE